MLARLARWSFRRRRVMVFAIWVPLLIGLSVVSGAMGADYRSSFTLPDSESKMVQEALQGIGNGEQAGMVAQIVFTAPQGTADPAVVEAMNGLFDQVGQIPGVTVTSPYSPEGTRFNSAAQPISFAQLSVTERDQQQMLQLGNQIKEMGASIDVPGLPYLR